MSMPFPRTQSFTDEIFSLRARTQLLSTARRRFNRRSLLLAPLSYPLKQSSLSAVCGINDWMPLGRFAWQDSTIELCQESIPGVGLSIKRGVDLLLSLVGLVALWPVMFAIALAVKLESPGPAIYCSLRVGKRGRRFSCYKFRTMIRDAEKLKDNLRPLNQRHGPFFKIADDPRVTRLGRFLRKYSLDELPQFWNVLRGEMSLVGPRPHPVEDCAQYTFDHCRRLGVKPGVTGLWQVSGRRDPSFETSMTLDMAYIEKWNLLLDFLILLRTIPAVFAGEGQ
jgi:lipopolysaccharide/colanic/teichoic acid biosynthesis glycosyltransferase